MQVEFALLADAVATPPDGKLYVLGGGIDTIGVQRFPATHPFLALVVKLQLHPTECDRQHHLEIELWDPDGKRIGPKIAGDFSAQRNRSNPTRSVFVQLVFNIAGLQLTGPGEHEFHILVDGQHRKTIPLYIHHVEQGPAHS